VENLGQFARTEIVEKLLHLDGNPFSFQDYPFFKAIYDNNSTEILLKTARQVGKTVCCAATTIIEAVSTPHFKTLYVSPTKEQTSTFSNTKLTKILNHSPAIRNAYVDPELTNNVLLIILKNGSEMILSYACDDPDRIRGKTADRELIDEVQDIQYDAVIPVVKECMANSNYGYTIYAGTPKSLENTIEYLWQTSTKAEWVIKCEGCNQHQIVESARSIGKTGAVCLHCGKNLNVRNGFWYDFNPKARLKGFHVSQPMLPLNNENPKRWERILDKLERYSTAKFNNEVLGISDARGDRLISLEELEALCEDYYSNAPPTPAALEGVRAIVGGVDWSGYGEDYVSRTVVWVFGICADYKLKTLAYKIFKESNPVADVEAAAEMLRQCNCQCIVGDAGNGAIANAMLRDKLGQHRVFQAQYGAYNGKMLRWNRRDRYLIDRTAAIDSFMLQMKRQGVIFPSLKQMAQPIQDILNEYEETTQQGTRSGGRRVWRHAPTAPDDCLHAMVFAWLATKILQGEVEFYERED
jgi:ribosomal protein S27E